MRVIILTLSLLFSYCALAASAVQLDHANIDLSDKASLQRGAKLFVDYCLGCHSTQYQRYQRVADDLEIPYDQMEQELVVTGGKIGDLMKSAIDEQQAQKWFGAAPTDLTLTARTRGADWLYTYLRTFYADESRPFGVNNIVYPNVAMHHALEELQGIPTKVVETQLIDGKEVEVIVGVEVDGSGALSVEEYDKAVLDLVNFLAYSAEPIALERQRLGYWVIGFLLIFLVFAYLLKREFWRDVESSR